ncbi:hypothetical protein BWP24_07200 [Vibrio campbellii]|uniref:hypothetical protein n=1 Tax=Vibrio harveyi group TaxID=717610 RepID=UPI000971A3D1|nr:MULTISPECIES: hypothetical protein [Vibrio harveyi group]APX05955.1 hypothetical protein BWP24_07200 [Vibrio campbellii]MCG9550260.1 hypothetical protein [Vibrio harveyi]HDM8220443.1 hypothetical protein [Vibrio campbellii]
MGAPNKMNVDEIRKLANDIREINNFTENHNFDSSLLSVNVTPASNSSKGDSSFDKSVWVCGFSVIAVLACVFSNVYFGFEAKHTTLLFLTSLLLTGIASIATHLRFQNGVATGILACFLVAIILIGFDIYTPKEVVNEAKGIIPGS